MFGKHPRGLAPLFFTEMWERFSFYTMMALLVLYMEAKDQDGGLGFSKPGAAQIYGGYIALVYFTPLLGGWLADRFWGFGRTIIIGGIAMMIGHLALAGEGLTFFFTGLLFLIIGNGLFKPNISTMLGNLYRDRPELKDQGYNIFYMGINVGALIAPIVATILKYYFGWHVAFGIAAAGMLVSVVIFMLCQQMVAEGEIKATDKAGEEIAPEVERLRIKALLVIFAVVAFFWMAFHQNGLTFIRWARDHTEPLILWAGAESEPSGAKDVKETTSATKASTPVVGIDFKENASLTKAINPALVIILTPLLVLFWAWREKRGVPVSTPRKLLIGMLLTAGALVVLSVGGLMGADETSGRVSIAWLFSAYFVITIAELCLSPMGLSLVSKLAPKRHAGLLMGGWFMSTAIGNYLAGAVAWMFWDTWPRSAFFFLLTCTSLVAAGLLWLSMPLLQAAMATLNQEPTSPAEPSPNGSAAPASPLASAPPVERQS